MRTAIAAAFLAPALAAQLPRSLTPSEAAWLATHPLTATDAPTPPPTGPVHCVPEYEPMDGLMIVWEGPSSWTNILEQIALHVTTTAQARIFVLCDTQSERSFVLSTLQAAGCDMTRVVPHVVTTDSIWCRDYGPRYIFEGDCRAIVDHTYNRPRPNDNLVPSIFGLRMGHRVYELPLIHGGGNYHLNALTDSFTTRLIVNENPGLTEQQIHDIWRDYQNVFTTFTNPFPNYVDATQHIDMWLQVYADKGALISDWPFNQGSIQDQICDALANQLLALGWTVHRIPARSVSGTHYTYTNMVLCNNVALVPQYTNSQVTQHNAAALYSWQQALPNHTVVGINCESIVAAAGVMHCIVMHVPKHRGGLTPTAYLKYPNGGESLAAGQQVWVTWNADDDVQVSSVDLELSTDGGATWQAMASALPHTGAYSWTVPTQKSNSARVRVTAWDAQGRSAQDGSDLDIALTGPPCNASVSVFGIGKAGSNGVPVLAGNNLPLLGTWFDLQLTQALPSSPFFLIHGLNPGATFFDGGIVWVNWNAYYLLTTDPQGSWQQQFNVPNNPVLCGLEIYLQAWIPNDPGAAGLGWAASNGLKVVVGQ